MWHPQSFFAIWFEDSSKLLPNPFLSHNFHPFISPNQAFHDVEMTRKARLPFFVRHSILAKFSFSSPNTRWSSHWSGWLRCCSGNKRRWWEGSCLNHSPSSVPSPRAAGQCLSEYTLVLFLRKPNLEVTSRSNCASMESKFWKETKRSLEASDWRESLMD